MKYTADISPRGTYAVWFGQTYIGEAKRRRDVADLIRQHKGNQP